MLLLLTWVCSTFCTMAHAKTARTYYTDELVASARGKVQRHDWAKQRVEHLQRACAWVLEMDEWQLWDFVPPHDQLRALYVSFKNGCPVHGREISRRGGEYAWLHSRDKPFKVECPIGHELYPSNDFVPWHHGGQEGKIDTTQQYVDDGNGHFRDGERFSFVGYYIFWQRWRKDILEMLEPLAEAYMLTDDARYARACAVLLSAIAHYYPHMDYNTQATHRDEPPHRYPGAILDRVWETTSVIVPIAKAYDAIYPSLDDPRLKAFLAEKGVADPREHIENNLLWVMVDNVTGGRDGTKKIKAVGNFGMHQRALATLALVLDNRDPRRGMTTDEMVQWLMRGAGGIEAALWNKVYRDGHGGESSPSYSSHWATDLTLIAQLLQQAGYSLLEHPKMHRMARVNLDMAMLGECVPAIGDCGSIFGAMRVGWRPAVQLPAFEVSGDPRLAKALLMMDVKDNDLWRDVPMQRIEEAAAQYGDWPRSTRHLPGFGLTIADSPGHDVGVSMYYGYAGGGHGHRDRLTIEMFAFGKPLLTDMGYPVPMGTTDQTPKRFYWSGNNISHYCPVVNRTWQATFDRGELNMLVGTPRMQLFDASAQKVTYEAVCSLYRRTAMLIENPDGVSPPYLLDIFRIDGGWEHAWTFHGFPFADVETFGIDTGPVQEQGTLAGEDVPFNGIPTGKTKRESGFQYLFNVRRAPPPSGGGNFGATWMDTKSDIRMRMTMLTGGIDEVVLADSEPQLEPRTPPVLPYMLAFRRGDDGSLASDFVAVVEPLRGDSTLTGMTQLPTEGAAHGVAVQVNMPAGTQYVLSNLGSSDQLRCDVAALHGETALLHVRDEKLQSLTAINVRELTTPWLALKAAALLHGHVRSVDYDANTLTLDRKIDNAQMLVGQTVFFQNSRRRASYAITGVGADQGMTTLHFGDIPLIVGVGQVGGIDAGEGKITTSTVFDRFSIDGGDLRGRRLLNHDRTVAFAIDAFDLTTFTLTGSAVSSPSNGTRGRLTHLFKPGDENKGRFWVGEVGINDQWMIPAAARIDRTADDRLAVVSNVALTLTIGGETTTIDAGAVTLAASP